MLWDLYVYILCVYVYKKWDNKNYFDIDFDWVVNHHSVVPFKHAILHFSIYFMLSNPSFKIN